jgi:adenosine deaminase
MAESEHHKNIEELSKQLTMPLRILTFLQELPETEIHIHMEAMVTVETILMLIRKNNLSDKLNIHNDDQLYEKFQVNNINDFIQVFYLIQSVIKTEEDFIYLVKDAKNYCRRNNIYYAEIFLAPTMFIKNGLSFEKFIYIIDEELKNKKDDDFNCEIKILLDVSRNYGTDNAMNNLDLLLKHRTESVIGIGLGGAENLDGADAKNFKSVYNKAIENGLNVVAHAGEVTGPELIWETIRELNISRIGHGISAIYDDKLIDYLKEKQIPLEICPTSNLFTQKYVKELSHHPIREFYDRGLYVTVNSDDPSIFGVELNDEYLNLYKYTNFTISEIIHLIKNNLYATFLTQEKKDEHWKGVEKEIVRLAQKYEIDIE